MIATYYVEIRDPYTQNHLGIHFKGQRNNLDFSLKTLLRIKFENFYEIWKILKKYPPPLQLYEYPAWGWNPEKSYFRIL